ncbi:MAG: histidine phosphatase family protein [Sedimentibacter sp.]|uniref:histidine phosphatase family protein n=1 Tax=Sedimentibacter sp. TaxID=1960295 RepID=UPI0031597555
MSELRKIYLIRHCEPELPKGIPVCIGKTDIPLSNIGRSQANVLKEFFSHIEINSIFSSPLIRARETAEIISDKKLKVIVKNDFSEFDIGKWDGMSFAEIKEKYPKEYLERGENLENYIVEGGESMAHCRRRALTALYQTIDESNGNILIAAHAGVNRCILSGILGINIKDSFKLRHEYGSVNILNYDGIKLTSGKIGLCSTELSKESVCAQ